MLALPCMAWHPLMLCWPCRGWLPTRGRLDRVPGLPTPPQALSCASNSNLVLPDRWALDGLAARGGDPRRLIRPDGPTRGEVKVRCPWPVAARAGPARVVASHISCGVTASLPTCLPGSVAAPLPTCFPAWGTTHGRRPRVPAPVLGALPAHARGGQPAGSTAWPPGGVGWRIIRSGRWPVLCRRAVPGSRGRVPVCTPCRGCDWVDPLVELALGGKGWSQGAWPRELVRPRRCPMAGGQM